MALLPKRLRPAGRVDLSARIGTVVLPNPVLTAAGTAGHGAELAPYFDLSTIGAVVVKSMSAAAWGGNPARHCSVADRDAARVPLRGGPLRPGTPRSVLQGPAGVGSPGEVREFELPIRALRAHGRLGRSRRNRACLLQESVFG